MNQPIYISLDQQTNFYEFKSGRKIFKATIAGYHFFTVGFSYKQSFDQKYTLFLTHIYSYLVVFC